MRFFLSSSLAALSLISTVIALPQEKAADPEWDDSVDEPQYTIFNGQKVPPILEHNGDKFDEEVKKGYWFVKHYSPNCHHCRDFAPVWQTYHEYLYTSTPELSEDEKAIAPRDFTSYYDFHLSSLNCIAWGNTCDKHKINMYPIMILYKDGVEIERYPGAKTLTALNEFVEGHLEKIKPGARPRGLPLPEVGANGIPGYEEQAYAAAASPSAPAAVVETPAIVATSATVATLAVQEPAAKTPVAEVPAAASPKTTPLLKATPVAPAPEKLVASSSVKAVESSAVAVTPAKPKKNTPSPNLTGQSISLTAESFQKSVLMSQQPWLIKFYAPWCQHCQAMAPVWKQLGKEMKSKLNIGEVNCDVESRLCKDVGVHAFPTIMFFRGGERVEYNGLRGLGDFVSYSNKAIQACEGVQDVDAASFKELEEKEEVIFLYFYDHATTSEDFRALDRLTLSLIGHARLVKTNSAALADRFKITTWPRLLVSRDGRPTYYTPLSPRDMRDFNMLHNWMRSVWLPIVPELTATNSNEIMAGKLVVLGILNRERPDEFAIAKKEIKSAAMEWMDKETQLFQLERQEMRDAKQLRIEEAEDRNDQRALRSAKSIRIDMSMSDRKQVAFAWVDGVFWERWVRTTYGIDVQDGERVIINDEDNKRYWDTTITGNYIIPSRTSILETIPKVVSSPPKIKPKLTISSFEKIFFDMSGTIGEHPYLTIGFFIAVVLLFVYVGRGRARRGRGGFFRLDEKDGILGVNGNGKVD